MARDHAAVHLIDERPAGEIAMAGADKSQRPPGHRHVLQLPDRDISGAEAVVDVVVVIGDVVGECGDLAFERGKVSRRKSWTLI